MKNSNSILWIDLDAIAANVDVLASYLPDGVGQMAVVKADAYGHGAVEVARKLEEKVDWFAVNKIEEGIELRAKGIGTPVLVLKPPPATKIEAYPTHDLTATISSMDHFDLLVNGTDYHLNFDTGMGRLGFRPGQLDEVIRQKNHHPNLQCTGLYSHLATADEINSPQIADQLASFQKIQARFDEDIAIHLCNTAGIIQCRSGYFNLVRSGIGVYGFAPGAVSIPGLRPAMHWQTQLVQVNRITKGENVSYGARWVAPTDGWIGVIPVGYEDGIPRGLTAKLEVIIAGKLYPVVGTITMNYCMIWLGRNRVEKGEWVELWNDGITASTWAKRHQSIPYEMLIRASDRATRQYE